MTDAERLQKLFEAQHPCVSITTIEEDDALVAIRTMCVEAQVSLRFWSMTRGVHDGLLTNTPPVPDTSHPAAALYHLLTIEGQFIAATVDLAPHLKDERTLRTLRDLLRKMTRTGSMLVMIDANGEVPASIRSITTPFDLSLPDEKELEQVIKSTLRARVESSRLQVDIDRRAFQTILRNLRGLSARQARQVILDTVCHDSRLSASDVNTVLAEKRKQFQSTGVLEYVEAPVDLTEIGGLCHFKSWLKTRQLSLSDEAINFGIPAPRGVLMLGVQGAGKSLAAKAVATSWQIPLLRLDAGALYDKFVGESENRLRNALKQAEMMAPIVLWVDEIEKAFASAAAQSTDGGLSKRMFGSLLTWMQEHSSAVFLIATANDIAALPPELLRKGRFDEIFWVDLPTLEARRDIFAIHLKKRKRDPSQFDLNALAEAAAGFSGAEIEQAVIASLHNAFAARSEVTTAHVLAAIKASPPLSVTMAEQVAALRMWAHGRCVPAD